MGVCLLPSVDVSKGTSTKSPFGKLRMPTENLARSSKRENVASIDLNSQNGAEGPSIPAVLNGHTTPPKRNLTNSSVHSPQKKKTPTAS